MIESKMTCTAEGGKHQVINSIYERHIQAQDETDEAVGQKNDRSREVDPHEFPLAKLNTLSKMAASVPHPFRVVRSHIISHANDWSICFVHEWD